MHDCTCDQGLVIPLHVTQFVTVHEVGGWVHEEVDGRASSVARESGGVSKRASVSYGARVCRVMHADPETTNRFVSECGTFE